MIEIALYSFFSLIIIWFIGWILVSSSENKKLVFLSPWIGIFLITNIILILNFSKLVFNKSAFNQLLFNVPVFLLIILILLFIFFVFFIGNKNIKGLIKGYFKYTIAISLILPLFFNYLGDSYIANRANELKELSIPQEMFFTLSNNEKIWQAGASILTALHSEVFKISTLDAVKILQGITIFLNLYIFIYILSNFLKPKTIFLKILSILLTTGFFALLLSNNFNFSLILGSIFCLAILLYEFLKIINNTPNIKIFFIEEFLIAFVLIFLASLNSLIFKFSLFIIFIIFLYLLSFKVSNKTLVFLRPLLLALLINPMLVGFALNF